MADGSFNECFLHAQTNDLSPSLKFLSVKTMSRSVWSERRFHHQFPCLSAKLLSALKSDLPEFIVLVQDSDNISGSSLKISATFHHILLLISVLNGKSYN